MQVDDGEFEPDRLLYRSLDTEYDGCGSLDYA